MICVLTSVAAGLAVIVPWAVAFIYCFYTAFVDVSHIQGLVKPVNVNNLIMEK